MIIRNITINNFQSYYGEQVLKFGQGLNLIVGNGGKGKSKLFNAFYWVLFGRIYITEVGWCQTETLPHSAKFAMQKHEFINKRALSLTPVNEEVRVSVQIELEDDKGYKYTIERSVNALRLEGVDWDNSSSWNVKPTILKVSSETKTGSRFYTDMLAEDIISKLFPDGIRNYIWFQGESLENLINFRNKETLKSAVKHISYFPFYEKLSEIISKSKDRISKIESRKIKELNKHNSTVSSLLNTISSFTNKKEGEEENKKQIESNIAKIQLALTEGENKISGLASYTSLVKRYDDCEKEIVKLNADISHIDEFQRSKLPLLWILRGTENLLEQCRDIIEQHKAEEYTVPEKKYLDNPSRAKLEEILRDKRCFVCGTTFKENDATYHYILERLKLQDEYLKEMEEYTNNMQFSKQFNMFVGQIQDYPSSLIASLSQIDKQWKDSDNDLEKNMAVRRRKNAEKDKLDEEIDDVKKKYGVDPREQAHSAGILNSSIRASRSSLESQNRKLQNSIAAIKQYNSEIRTAEKELEKLGKSDHTIMTVPETEWKNISSFLADICVRVQENARKELLRKIEERANEFYSKFTEHDVGYKGNVKIEDDYSIEFDPGLNTSHEDRKKMSIINALLSLNQEAMNIYYPFISDAPTSSFDPETTHKYLLGIKDMFVQSIIMTKDIDIESPKYLDLISQGNVSKVYSLRSHLYCDEGNEPKLNEVSTEVIPIR